VSLDDLKRHYHLICFATGAQTDRRLGIPGEDLARSCPATEFVAWYNGHPEFTGCTFDLSVERVAVVGVGNVAVDVARILCRTPDELAKTDIAPYAEAALIESRVREVYLLGRRGPVQAAFTTPEVRELGELLGADVFIPPEDVALDPLSQAELDRSGDRALQKKVEILREFSRRPRTGKPRLLTLRFLVSPVELLGDAAGGVRAMRLVRNALVDDGKGGLKAVATERTEKIPIDMVFRSVGYRGVALAGLPFDEKRGTVPNADGRVTDGGGRAIAGLYVSGWIKRGPTGVIGTNKPCGAETARAMLDDVARGQTLHPSEPDPAACEAFVRSRQPAVVTYEDWIHLDRHEVERGKAAGRPRVKFTSVDDMLGTLAK
jgi:ferredoxin--NADP+ reductase